MTEQRDRRGVETRPAEVGSPEWYVSTFRQNWRNLRVEKRPKAIFGLENIGLDNRAINMRKYTPTVLQELVGVNGQPLRFDVLISPDSYPEEGPYHKDIEDLYRFRDNSTVRNMHRGEVFEASDGNKYLLLMMGTFDLRGGKSADYSVEANGQEYQEQLLRDMARYGITALFVSPHTDYGDYSVKGVLAAPGFLTKLMEEHVLDRFARGVARQRGWTNTQFLRFKLTREMPK